MKDISIPLNKVDNESKISGSAEYVNDIRFGDCYYASTVRSTSAHAEITGISIPDLPEDIHIVDSSDITGSNYVAVINDDWPVFADKKVSYIGEPVMLVVGRDRTLVERIRAQIKISYRELAPVLTLEDAVKENSPVISYKISRGDYSRAAAGSVRIFRESFRTGLQEQAYIEPQGAVAEFIDGGVKITGSIQCPYYVKNAVINALGCPPEKVRVIQAETGGAFGGKEEFPSLICIQAAVACMKLKKTVKLIYERKEDISFTTKRHPSLIDYEAAVDEDGKITAIKMDVHLDGGASTGLSGVVLQRSMIASCGVYEFETVLVNGHVHKTNLVPNGAFRGFGAPQTFFAIEQFMNHIADDLGIERIEFKMKHLAVRGSKTSTGGNYHHSILLPEMIAEVKKMSDYDRKRKLYGSDGSNRGIGISVYLHGCGFTGSGEQDHIKAKVKLARNEEGKVEILVANVDMGQGFKTAMIKIVSDSLGIPVSDVLFCNPDTSRVPDSGPTVASRSTMIVGGLLKEACAKLLEKNGAYVAETCYRQPEYVKWDQNTLTGDAYPAYSWGVTAVETEFDPATYEISLLGVWTAFDIGKAIDERIIKGQIDGGILQGISYGLYEKMEASDGRVLQNSLTDYMIPTAADSVRIEYKLFDNPFAEGPYGAKGAGELTLIGGAPAAAAAVEQAAGNIRISRIPATPEYLMELKNNG